MARKNVNVGTIKDVSGTVNVAAGNITQTFNQIIQRALTAAEEAAQARTLEYALLAHGVATLAQSLAGQASMGTQSDNPYKGLLYYGLNEAEIFFGRNQAREDLLSAMGEGTLTVLHAESGAGKTSLLQAGVAARLIAAGHLAIHLRTYDADPVDFVKGMFLPQRTQAPGLAEASLREFLRQVCAVLGPKVHLYLLLDQFEEFFHHLKKGERAPFLESLASCLNDPSLRVRWVFALRADALSNLAELESFGIAPFKNMYRLERLRRGEAREVIIEPAKRFGISYEPALIEHILDTLTINAEIMPTQLQLVCSALTDDLPEDKTLTLTYFIDQEGGTEGILRDYLKRQLEHLPAAEQALAWKVLRLLITADYQRAVKPYDEIMGEIKAEGVSKKQIDTVLTRLVERRLLFTQPATVELFELAHDYLVKEIQLDPQEQARKAAQELLDQERRAYQRYGTLLSPERLAVIEPHRDQLRIAPESEALLQESQKAVQREQRERERRRKLLVRSSLAIAVVMTLLAFWAIKSSQDATRQSTISRAGELAALALAERSGHFDTALLFGLEAFHKLDNAQTEGALLSLSDLNPGLEQYLAGHKSFVYSLAFSPDGARMASGSNDKLVILWDVGDPKARRQLARLSGHTSSVRSVAFSPDGNTLASSSDDGVILLWDIRNPEMPFQLGTLEQHQGAVLSVAFHPDGKLLASGGVDQEIILWDISDPQAASPLTVLSANRDLVDSVIFSPDGRTLASGGNDSRIFLWDVRDPKAPVQLAELSAQQGVIGSLAFSPDSQTLASGGEDPKIILWDVSDPGAASPLGAYSEHTSFVLSLAFSPDGKQLASGSYDTSVILWDVSDPSSAHFLMKLYGHLSPVSSVAFHPQGTGLASGSYDTTIIFWDIHNPRAASQRAVLSPHSGDLASLAFSLDGQRLASGSGDHTIILWDVHDPDAPAQLSTLAVHKAAVSSVAFAPSGRQLASGSYDRTIILWDISEPASAHPLSTLSEHADTVSSVAYSPDGNMLASGSWDGTILLWDVRDPKKPLELASLAAHTSYVSSVTFSPDGKTLASGSLDNTIILWNITDPKAPTQFPSFSGDHSIPMSLAFSPDGKTLAAGHDDSMVILWDISNPRAPAELATLSGHSSAVNSVTFSPDGRRLAAGGDDGYIMIWDVSHPRVPYRLATLVLPHFVRSLAFRPDGNTLASGSFDNTLILWDFDPQSWAAKACQRVGRNFTQAEWAQYFPNEKYRKTCEQWPSGE
jgi:WD40 repeat protein